MRFQVLKKIMVWSLSVSMVLNMVLVNPVYAAVNQSDTSEAKPVCENHRQHDAGCGYTPAEEGEVCAHVHDDTCGYTEAVEESPCTYVPDDVTTPSSADKVHVHDENCGYRPESGGASCNHIHDRACGYKESSPGTACTHACELCQERPQIEITGFAELDQAISHQSLMVDSVLEDIQLPSSLEAEAVTGSIQIDGITWDCSDSGTGGFDGSVSGGKYIFTPELPDGYYVGSDVEIPRITVVISEAALLAISFEGMGTKLEPYLIFDEYDLVSLAASVNRGKSYTGEYFKLMENIDLSAEWIPIGVSETKPFDGVFEGNGNQITNLYIGTEDTPSSLKYAGLFGYCTGSVINLGVCAEIYSDCPDARVGGISGYYDGIIKNCYVMGNVTALGERSCVGGLIGYGKLNIGASGIYNSFSTADVTGGDAAWVGGLGGYCPERIGVLDNNYASGIIEGGDEEKTGGLFGEGSQASYQASYQPSYWNKDLIPVSGVTGGKNLGKTTEEMKSQSFAELLNSVKTSGSINWFISANQDINQGYPIQPHSQNLFDFSGSGTEEDPFLIVRGGLRLLANYVNAGIDCSNLWFKLDGDQDLGSEWTPIGLSKELPFNGKLDGDGKMIKVPMIVKGMAHPNEYIGIFGYMGEEAEIRNLGIFTSVQIDNKSGISEVGSLAGYNQGTVMNCYVRGTIRFNIKDGYPSAGGLIGENRGIVTGCYSSMSITSQTTSSGSIGALFSYTEAVNNCYWNTGLMAKGTNSGSNRGILGKSEEELKSEEFVRQINAGVTDEKSLLWQFDGENKNEGYPVHSDGFGGGVPEVPLEMDGGSGTEADPYLISQISSLESLQAVVSSGQDCRNLYFRLADKISIDSSERITIGTEQAPFNGIFDGDNRIVEGNGGFGCVGRYGEIKNIEHHSLYYCLIERNYGVITNCSVYGKNSLKAGLVNYNYGVVADCSTDVPVKASAGGVVGGVVSNNIMGEIRNCSSSAEVGDYLINQDILGGLVGLNDRGTIINSYSISKVQASKNNVPIGGGLVGKNTGSIINCYAGGDVSGGIDLKYLGRLIGENTGTVTDSYCSSYGKKVGFGDDSGIVTLGVLLANSEELLQRLNAGLYNDKMNVWLMEADLNEGYPLLSDEAWTSSFPNGGDGQKDSPFVIADEADLHKLSDMVNKGTDYSGKYFILANDIELTGEWMPIGSVDDTPFNGRFDGNGKQITGIRIGEEGDPADTVYYAGLFGVLGSEAEIRNLGVSAEIYIGAASSHAGGIAGYSEGAVIADCYATGVLVGGAGVNVGGLLGDNKGDLINCYTVARIKGVSNTRAGGIAGHNGGNIVNCYWNTDTAGRGVGYGELTGLLKKTDDEMKTAAFAELLNSMVPKDGLYRWTIDNSEINGGYPILKKAVYYTVSFESDGGTAVREMRVLEGEKIRKPEDPVKSGYTFGGWYQDRALSETWKFDTDEVHADIRLYAKWIPEEEQSTDKTALLAEIASAREKMHNTSVSMQDGADVPDTGYWVTEEIMRRITEALSAAERLAADPQAAQSDVTAAADELRRACNAFVIAKKPGSKEEEQSVDKTVLLEEIANAEKVMFNTIVSTQDGTDVPRGQYWVTENVMEQITEALSAAKELAADPQAAQSDVTAAVAVLRAAGDAFSNAKKPGRKSEGGDSSEGGSSEGGSSEGGSSEGGSSSGGSSGGGSSSGGSSGGGSSSGGSSGGGSSSSGPKDKNVSAPVYEETPGTWQQSQNGWKYLKPDGTAYTNTWAYVNGKWYWLDSDGDMAQGWEEINGKKYFLKPETGEMLTGWVQYNNAWYFTDETGAMKTGWVEADGKWYYMGAEGVMLADTVTPDGYKVDSNGAWVR